MQVELTNEERMQFSNIMFQSRGREHEQIEKLSPMQASKLKTYYAQKITYDVVNSHITPPAELSQPNTAPSQGFLQKICCCCAPDQFLHNFDVTTSLFLKRTFSSLAIWRSNFLQIGEASPDMYGPFWLTVAYIIALGLAANLNEYFILPQNYQFDNSFLLKSLGLVAIFKILEPIAYSAVVKGLGGTMTFIESSMLTGYSMTLYMVPTFLCLIPSQYWHIVMLLLGGLIRAIFLWRNYSSKLEGRKLLMLPGILIVEALFAFAVFKLMFPKNNGKNFSDGTKQVFHLRTYQHQLETVTL